MELQLDPQTLIKYISQQRDGALNENAILKAQLEVVVKKLEEFEQQQVAKKEGSENVPG